MSKYFVLKPQHMNGKYLCISTDAHDHYHPIELHKATIFDENDYQYFMDNLHYYGLEEVTFIKQPIILQELLSSDAK